MLSILEINHCKLCQKGQKTIAVWENNGSNHAAFLKGISEDLAPLTGKLACLQPWALKKKGANLNYGPSSISYIITQQQYNRGIAEFCFSATISGSALLITAESKGWGLTTQPELTISFAFNEKSVKLEVISRNIAEQLQQDLPASTELTIENPLIGLMLTAEKSHLPVFALLSPGLASKFPIFRTHRAASHLRILASSD